MALSYRLTITNRSLGIPYTSVTSQLRSAYQSVTFSTNIRHRIPIQIIRAAALTAKVRGARIHAVGDARGNVVRPGSVDARDDGSANG